MKRLAFVAASLAVAAACNRDITGLEPPSNPATETFAPSLGVNIPAMNNTGGVYYTDLVVGTGAEVSGTTDSLRVTYAAYLKTGDQFEAATNVRMIPLATIPGFRIGIQGMKQGGRRKIVIPSELGYGRTTIKNTDGKTIRVPRQSTLIFDIDALQVYNPATS